jgi:hypothetical protein
MAVTGHLPSPGGILLSKWLDSLGSLFKGTRGIPSDKNLEKLAEEAERASPGSRWAVFNRLGDAYLKAGDRPRALRYFGKAIDALLLDDQPEPARAVAKKVIRLHPEAIRTLCTVTWLDLASGKMPTAVGSLRDYVQGAMAGGQERLACGQVLEMARLVPDATFLGHAIKALEDLGCSSNAAQAKEWLEEGKPPSAPKDKKTLHALCLKAAIGSNVKMKDKGTVV